MASHVVCHSGGVSSALSAIEVAARFGREDVTLINHDMHFTVEHPTIKAFKQAVADHIGVPITFVSHKNATMDQFDVCVEAGAFKVNAGGKKGHELCTARLKTEPFMAWMRENDPDRKATVYYGFDASEMHRVQRRSSIMGEQGWKTGFPMLWPDRTVMTPEELGIARPSTYSVFKHGNCIGCLKAGWQHWYIVYVTRPDIWLKGKWAEEEIGYAIHHGDDGPMFLEDMEPRFEAMKAAGIPATEHIPHQRFWATARKVIEIKPQVELELPCECTEAA